MNHAKSLVGNKDPLSPDINDTAAKDTKQQDLGNIADITSTKSTPLKLNMSSPDGIAVIIGTNFIITRIYRTFYMQRMTLKR